jgi:hypothetical protein
MARISKINQFKADIRAMSFREFEKVAGVIGYRVNVCGIRNKAVLAQYEAITAERKFRYSR